METRLNFPHKKFVLCCGEYTHAVRTRVSTAGATKDIVVTAVIRLVMRALVFARNEHRSAIWPEAHFHPNPPVDAPVVPTMRAQVER